MEHSFIDKYSNLNTFLHRLDPRTKFVTIILFIIALVCVSPSHALQFVPFALMLMILVIMSKIPIIFILKKSLIVIPFVLFVSIFLPFVKKGNPVLCFNILKSDFCITDAGITTFLMVMAKSFLSMVALVLLSGTTKFFDLLNGLYRLKIPVIFIMLLSFMYRYIFVLVDEAMRMQRARSLRYFGGKKFQQVKVLSNMIGILFIKTYERSEKIYESMLARGFNGHIASIKPLALGVADYTFFLTVLATLILTKVLL